ncbi:MAG: hypothetical protein A3G34_07400 [Candidatus Lindowbacteria bacterium RIFCSPLOWO2_12_FULL_62_27]|nr:MAG: hypothetical protein A3G34_07400 [Candidatus Lindowbacteria bacterium RIFCSPLOWO2_12_FULL_62_27]OGH61880.1 MAG: hypothetical protein A3I06_16810 [Candidatus Lindowbacteria bacterium RIFCSPLOWO2_02_FULL_62_12]
MPPIKQKIDALGLFCPVPLHMIGRAFRKMQAGDCVELVGDDPGLRTDMEDWTAANRHRIVERRQEGRILAFVVEKGR